MTTTARLAVTPSSDWLLPVHPADDTHLFTCTRSLFLNLMRKKLLLFYCRISTTVYPQCTSVIKQPGTNSCSWICHTDVHSWREKHGSCGSVLEGNVPFSELKVSRGAETRSSNRVKAESAFMTQLPPGKPETLNR